MVLFLPGSHSDDVDGAVAKWKKASDFCSCCRFLLQANVSSWTLLAWSRNVPSEWTKRAESTYLCNNPSAIYWEIEVRELENGHRVVFWIFYNGVLLHRKLIHKQYSWHHKYAWKYYFEYINPFYLMWLLNSVKTNSNKKDHQQTDLYP